MNILETERLTLRKLSMDDAAFILALLNDAAFLQFVGDKGVRTIADARDYIQWGPIDSYERLGFGLYLTALKPDDIPIGICGLLKREALEDVDIGFALLPQYRSRGYAYEAASAIRQYASGVCGLQRLVAVTAPDNHGSVRILEKIGLRFERMVRLTPGGPEIKLFGTGRNDRFSGASSTTT